MKIKMYYGLRFLQITGLIVAIIIMLIQFNELRMISKSVSYQQTEKYSYTLTNLAAAEASRYLSQSKTKELQILINDLSNDPMVRDATIYDHLGKTLYQSNDPLLLPVLLRIDKTSTREIAGITPYIAELYKENEKIGYIRISLRKDHILGIIFDYQQQTLEILILLLTLSFIVGGIIMALFYNRIKGYYYRLSKVIPNLISSNKKA